MADSLTEKRAELERRLRELRPLHDEYVRLERAMRALESAGLPTPTPAPAPAARPTNGRRRRGAGVRRRRRGGTRGEQALAVVRQNPGITVSELGDKLGIAQKNYLYRVMNNLQGDGAVRKQGRGYSAV